MRQEKPTTETNQIILVYLEENNITENIVCKLLKKTENWITIKTIHNILEIPIHRIIKIKHKQQEGDETK